MAAPRLPFLWPMLYKNTSVPRIRATQLHESASLASRRPRRCRQFATTPRRSEETTTKRYGKGIEPAPHLRDADAPKAPEQKSPAISEMKILEPAPEEHEEEEPPTPTPTATPSTPPKTSAIDDTAPPTKPPDPPKTGESKPLDSVLHMPSPADADHHKLPHLKTPPYVHHFDTYGLVKELHKSRYTPEQSTTLMKAVRGILINNMALAREGLVSKSNVENETYLFRAACSELKTEIGNGRKSQIERMRTERAQLQHEVDILGQRLGQETGTLKDELKGLFDDRKMAVRQEQRTMETKIQELNYKITVALNSDARSEVEGLRWVLTRRAAITVGVSAFMLFVALRYTSYVQHQQLEERRRQPPRHDPPPPPEQTSASTQTSYIDPTHGLQEALGGEILAGEGVSLG
ncbi:hypothetical protein HBI56_015970 [Parastagonospora nodorum]|nr:hypothetical protein HBH53_006740 [Parastagonospora nodorum]KAH3976822.1 hypothetical protein HBH51_074750 [Parastagonospora nodorum]KAH4007964.1 hypothetical protein HBI10_002620 [Parastagonospora nodorum]KAH4016625.1 hypothetical protein HBI13_150630 [Parastagonospora nodorum]KAH4040863.1 hypothetical protein HBI09_014820 [Parastagonospora nodorum]